MKNKNHNNHDHDTMHDHSHHDHSGHDHSHHDHSGHDHDHSGLGGHDMGNLKLMFFVSLIFAVPVMILSPMMGLTLPFQVYFEGSEWIVMILSTILFVYGGRPFFTHAKMEIEMKSPGMMTLISLGISVSYVYSMYAFTSNIILKQNLHLMDFFFELASLIVIMLLGHWIENSAIASAGNALEKMAQLLPSSAYVVQKDGSTKEVPLVDVQIDDVVIVRSGENMPVDGLIVSGSSTVNESMITGEALAIKKDVGDTVIGGSINGAGTLQVKVVGTGESGYLASVMKLVSEAQNDQSKRETLSQVVAKYLFYVALIVGILAFVIWYLVTKDINLALERLVTVLIIACPHALGLAIPLVVARSTSIGARNGLLVKNREAFENAHKVDIVLLDKTGTLTEGDFKVSNITSLSNSFSEDDILGRFSSLEESSSHPLAIGILNEAKNRKLKYELAEDVQTIAGVGLKGNLNNKELIIVNEKYLNTHNFDYNKDDIVKLAGQGNSISFIIEDNKLIGYIAQGDSIKESSYDLVKCLKERGIQVMMLTGDNEHFANLVSKELGLDAYYAQLMPEDKEKIVSQLQSSGKRIMMVGDGINDAPSLVRADVGVAIGVGTDIAIDSADIVLVKSKPSDILGLIDLSKKTSSKMVQNLWWGAGYNILAIPLAAGILAFAGIILTPALGAVLMSLSTVIVAMNAMLLKSI